MIKSWTADRWIASGLAVFSIFYVILAYNLPRFSMATIIDAHVFPMFIGIVQFALSIWLWLDSRDTAKKDSPWKSLELRGGLFMVLLSAVYIEMLPSIGFIVSTFIFLAISPYILGWKNWVISLVLAAILSMGTYWLFSTLMVPLPKGILGF
ncbi:MAG TPA: tripartite tricarboxylate transporter TctB family protein [Thermoanaerobacterales bacterium]|nr:tripartite tricarboxylate transporter TctB family protein [Thermoanaerobacterales bacterium]